MVDPALDRTTEWLEKEIRSAEKALDQKERKLSSMNDSGATNNNNNNEAGGVHCEEETVADRLGRLDREADDLLLAQDVAAWVVSKTKRQDTTTTSPTAAMLLLQDAADCAALGQVLCRHAPSTGTKNVAEGSNSSRSRIRSSTRRSGLYNELYQEEYLPLYNYLSKQLVLSLRQHLRRAKYPAMAGCRNLMVDVPTTDNNMNTNDDIVSLDTLVKHCTVISNLQSMHRSVIKQAQETTVPDAMDPVLLELVRPFVERLRFHFVQAAPDRPTSSRIDRLPEWLLTYVVDNILDGGPWDFVSNCLAPAIIVAGSSNTTTTNLPLDFLNELVRLVQWVLNERNFFRHPTVAGAGSKPLLLCNAIEQLIQFDDSMQNLLPPSNRLLSLTEIFVAGDSEILQWWLEREREAVFSNLYDTQGSEEDQPLLHRIAPRAELFAALIRSIQCKAAVFYFSGPYLHHVARPLCLSFLDALQATASDLRQRWTARRALVTERVIFQKHCVEWIELINGTHMAATQVAATEWLQDAAPDLSGDQDLARFGRSLQALEDVLLQEFCNSFVNTLLLERVKFAGYLMRCSHLLASNSSSEELNDTDVSTDLLETQRLLHAFLVVCNETSLETDTINPSDEMLSSREVAAFASSRMRDCALDRIAGHLLEVALDVQGMTPDLFRHGAVAFARDVDSLFSDSLVPPSVLRLLDITHLMSSESRELVQLGNALCGLAGESPPLSEDYFTLDSRLFEEAMSMIRSKGLVWIELGDVFAVLNRRRDL